jgi:hypothetical protein
MTNKFDISFPMYLMDCVHPCVIYVRIVCPSATRDVACSLSTPVGLYLNVFWNKLCLFAWHIYTLIEHIY